MGSGEDHGLLAEILKVCALGEKLRHVAYLMASLLREAVAGSREDGGAHKNGYIRELGDELFHKLEILRAIVLGRDVDLQECNINSTQIIIVALGGVTNEQFTLGVVAFQPVFQGSAYETASDNSNINH